MLADEGEEVSSDEEALDFDSIDLSGFTKDEREMWKKDRSKIPVRLKKALAFEVTFQ